MTDHDIIFAVIFTTLIILLLIAGVAITIFISNKQRITQEMKMAQMQVDYEKEMRTVQHEVQEQILVNVGRELHDNIGQLLTVMHMQLEHKKMGDAAMAVLLAPVQETLQGTIQQVKLLGRSLNSDLLEHNGLLSSIQAEIMRLQQLSYFALHWTSDGEEPELQKDQRLMVFRIFQELINNALKHAQASNIHVSMTGKGKFLLLVQDDGVGFDAEEKMKAGGSGLKNIMRRASLANLDCNIIAQIGKGCIFTVQQSDTQPSK